MTLKPDELLRLKGCPVPWKEDFRRRDLTRNIEVVGYPNPRIHPVRCEYPDHAAI